MMQMDTFDRKILTILQREADVALETLGMRVGLSRNAVWRRIKALEAAGVIRARVALLDPEQIGLGLSVFMLVRTDRHTPEWLEKFAVAVRDLPQILGAYRMTGDLDYLIHARVADVKDYDALYRALVARVDFGDVSASFVMEEIKETTEMPVF
ncbi:MAG: Lrp/AsnC family transcriptional regulator [Paracoccaceae bacterium]|nr:Lrp/AsnC family transcriptional regulator [Paracoccaceae bacterium]MDE3239157.1 Lrp/AsnC family transcriptional regulator [Paracoccaceae bacterium]